MKLFALLFASAIAASSQMKPIAKPAVDPVKCLVIDSVVIHEAACASGSCSTGPGVVTGEEFKRALLGGVEIIGHNACSTKQPVKLQFNMLVWNVVLSSYALPEDGTAATHSKVKEITTY